MNTSLLSIDIDQIANEKINIVPYQINQSGKYPFLQYFLLKYMKNGEGGGGGEEGSENDYISFINFENKDNTVILEICATALDILFLSYEELDPKYEYKGYTFYEGEYYMFFDCSEYQISTHNLNKQNDIWLTLVDEIINYKMVCQFKINDKVSKFFLNHQEYIKLEQIESNPIIYYESPIVAYAGCTSKKREFISTFGQLPNNDGLYYFFQFNDVYMDSASKRSGIIRFAIFPGNMRVPIDKSENKNILAREGEGEGEEEEEEEEEETKLTDWTIYDSLYLDKTWIIKNYNQQTILTSHLRENDKLYII
jgi:hypothetical protein